MRDFLLHPLYTIGLSVIFFVTGCNLLGSKHKGQPSGVFLPDGLSGIPINQLKIRDNQLYAGTDSGLYRSSFQEENWHFLGPGHNKIHSFYLLTGQEILLVYSLSVYTSMVYRTSNGGQTWKIFQNNLDGDTLKYPPIDLEGDPHNTNVIYAEGNGGYVAKTSGKDNSWKLLWGTWDELGFGRFVRVDPNNSQVIWSGGGSAFFSPLLIKSTNAGQSWQHLNPAVPVPETDVYDLVICPDNSDTVLAGMGTGIYKSMNGGQDWKIVYRKTGIYTLAQDSLNSSGIVYATGANQTNTLFYTVSHDFGDSWQTVTDTTANGPTGMITNDLVATTINGKEVLYFGTNKGVYKYIVPE